MAKSYQVWNGASVTTAAPAAVATGTAVKTMIQLATSASSELRVTEWWWEGDASAAATPGVVELMFVTSGAATITAYVAADIKKYDPNGRASLISLGSSSVSGYTASVEGTPVSPFSVPHQVPPTSGIYIQYPLGREPEAPVSTFVRLRNKFGTSINAICAVAWEE
jgi:hypothetical protein